MGADSAGTNGNLDRSLVNVKVLKRDGYLYGFSGDPTAIQRIRASFIPPTDTYDSPADFMSSIFIDHIKGLLIGYDLADNHHYQGHMLIGYKGRLFEIHSNYLVTECMRGYGAVGSGGSYALGSLFKSKGSATSRITRALEAAAEHNAGVAPPFTIVTGGSL